MSSTKITAGRALWELDRPLSDFPNRKSWEELGDDNRWRYETRALDILSTAEKLTNAMSGNDPAAGEKVEVEAIVPGKSDAFIDVRQRQKAEGGPRQPARTATCQGAIGGDDFGSNP